MYFNGRQRGLGEAVDDDEGLEGADDELQSLEEDSKDLREDKDLGEDLEGKKMQ